VRRRKRFRPVCVASIAKTRWQLIAIDNHRGGAVGGNSQPTGAVASGEVTKWNGADAIGFRKAGFIRRATLLRSPLPWATRARKLSTSVTSTTVSWQSARRANFSLSHHPDN
jgi:hypothetical protein